MHDVTRKLKLRGRVMFILLVLYIAVLSMAGCSDSNNDLNKDSDAGDEITSAITEAIDEMQHSSFIRFSIKDDDSGDYSHKRYPLIREQFVMKSVKDIIGSYEYKYVSDDPVSHYNEGALYLVFEQSEMIVIDTAEGMANVYIRLFQDTEINFELEADKALFTELEPIVMDHSRRLGVRMAQEFGAALEENSIGTLRRLVFDSDETIGSWGDFTISDVTISLDQDCQTLFHVDFNVDNPGNTPFKMGENHYVLDVNFAGLHSFYAVSNFIEEKKFREINRIRNMEPSSLLQKWINLTEVYQFESVESIDQKKLLEFLTLMAAEKNTELTCVNRRNYTQEEIDQIAREFFGLDSLVLTESKYYDQQLERYNLRGRGSSERYHYVVEHEYDEYRSMHTLLVEYYRDGLKTDIAELVLYTFIDKGDGIYQFVNAVPVKTD